MKLVKSGAYLVESFTGNEIDQSKWQRWLMDPSMHVEIGDRFLHIYGTTSMDKRAFTGLTTRQLYPADAMLMTEMSMPCRYDQRGTWFGFVTHLCNRVLGDEVRMLSIPDNNCEVTFGRMGEKLGWFFWWFDHGRGEFHKWVDDEPLKPFGDENSAFHTVRLSYDVVTRELEAGILDGGRWIRVGKPVRFLKLFSSIELKIDANAKALNLDVRFRNCRLFPNPKRNSVKVFVGDPSPRTGAIVELCDLDGKLITKSEVNSDGLATLNLSIDANFPLSGRFKIMLDQKVIDSMEITSDGVQGIYPGDFYASSA